MRTIKITKENFKNMTESFDNGIRNIYYSNSGTLENYFRVEVDENNYIIDWYWSSQTPNTYFVDDDITVYHISDYFVNCAIDNYLDECFYDIKEKFEEKYKDDEEALNSLSKWEDFREEYYGENEEDINFYLTSSDIEEFFNVFYDPEKEEEIGISFEIEEDEEV